MTTKVEYQSDRNLVIATYSNPLDPHNDIRNVVTEVGVRYSTTGPLLYTITDVTQLDITFSDLVVGLANATAHADGWRIGAPNSVTFVVGGGEMVSLTAQSVTQSQYGEAEIRLFESLEEAIAAVDQHRAKAQNA